MKRAENAFHNGHEECLHPTAMAVESTNKLTIGNQDFFRLIADLRRTKTAASKCIQAEAKAEAQAEQVRRAARIYMRPGFILTLHGFLVMEWNQTSSQSI